MTETGTREWAQLAMGQTIRREGGERRGEALSPAQERVLRERGQERLKGSTDPYLTSDGRIGKALVSRGLAYAELRRVRCAPGSYRSWEVQTAYYLTDEGIRAAEWMAGKPIAWPSGSPPGWQGHP